jgi:tetratricopeptide (TPR) repeat protein
MAEMLLALDQASAAHEHVKHVLKHAPNDAATRHLEGMVLDALDQPDAALAAFEHANRLEPGNAVYQTSLQAAVDGFESHGGGATVALATSTDMPSPVAADAAAPPPSPVPALPPAEAASTAQAARQEIDFASANEATMPDMILAVAAQSLAANELDKAEKSLSVAVRRWSNHPGLWRALGLCHYRRGRWQEAQVALTKAVSLDSTQALSYFLLGATLRQLGDQAEAERNLARAAELDPRYAAQR